jgi:RNA polymerase sigma factor (sigma-70 family)
VAEDAVQEALLIVCRYLPSLRSALAFDGWLAKIVRRECLRLARRFGKPDETANIVEELPEPLSVRPDHELRFDITRAIQSLPSIYRDVILLRDFEELTIREIAARLGIPVDTAKTRLYRGRVLIREHLLE